MCAKLPRTLLVLPVSSRSDVPWSELYEPCSRSAEARVSRAWKAHWDAAQFTMAGQEPSADTVSAARLRRRVDEKKQKDRRDECCKRSIEAAGLTC